MRFLEFGDNDELRLTKDIVENTEPYAILSHTWGPDNAEVSFNDLTKGTGKFKDGYHKVLFCAKQAARDGLQYCWVDTCCIDKSSSTELTEAINSMFRWYHNATKCYVYLSDVSTNDSNQVNPSMPSWQLSFRESRWFTRGWTLQELIAPPSVEFFSSNGTRLGNKESLEQQLHEITGIAISVLRGAPLSTFCVKERMSWAKNRETTREEDKAYCLLGIFDIHMPLIYGERAKGAFRRLNEEIEKIEKRLTKHRLEESSNATDATSNPSKKLKTLHSQATSIASSQHPKFFGLESHFPPESSMYNSIPGPLSMRNRLDMSIRQPEVEIPESCEMPSMETSHNIDATTKQSLINQLYFTKIDERLTSLTAAHGSTCTWFLTKPEFKSWHDLAQQPVHGGFLWIKGNPGTGKSTLMKLLFEEAKLNAKDNSLQITLSFFFLARGTAEEKSTEGLYRSLLHQLFEKVEELKDSLDWMTNDGARVIQRVGWREETLKQTLKHAIQKLGRRSLTLFIDALDECDERYATDMIFFFEELCDHARESHTRLQICFSSRHYPTVVIQKGIEVILEHEIGHTKDIEHYIKSKLRIGKPKQLKPLQSDILEKSSGIFLWVVLVLDILNSEYRRSISINKVRERLREIPQKLTDLFEMILQRDGENLEQLQVCLKWILFATRPLKPQELYFAIQLSIDRYSSSYWDQDDLDLDQIKKFVISSSKGLAEVTRNKATEVQFIHESVREFLLGKYESQWFKVSDNFVGHSHETLRDCCFTQLNALISENVELPNPLPQASKTARLRETISLKYPFLEYSVLSVLNHANSAQQNGINQRDFLDNFPLQLWISLSNALEKFDVRRYTNSVSIPYILAEKNLADLIRIHPERETCFVVGNERYGPPFFAALATGSHEAARTFLEVQAEVQPQQPLISQLCKQYARNRSERNIFGRDFKFSRHRSVTSYIAEQGDEVVFAFLDVLGVLEVESKDKVNRTPLSHAAEQGCEVIVNLLLEKGAELDTRDSSRRTPLSWAAKNGHEEVVKLLLEKGAELEAKGELYGQTPLSWAAGNGHEAIVKLLLEKGAELKTKDERYGQIPLSWAAENGHEAVVKLLLEKGVELDTGDSSCQTPLSWAAENGHEAVVKLLLEKGAELDTGDSSRRTPLSWAAENGHEAVVKLLLEKGAELEAKDELYGQTPLLWAAESGHEAVVKLLLEKGAELDTGDSSRRTPLSWAAKNGHEAVVKLLLEKGAELDARDSSCRTPLSNAAEMRHRETVVKLLLSAGASIESKCNSGRTPLSYAAQKGNMEIAKLLLDAGADVESKSSSGYTPLSYAMDAKYMLLVELLRAHSKNS